MLTSQDLNITRKRVIEQLVCWLQLQFQGKSGHKRMICSRLRISLKHAADVAMHVKCVTKQVMKCDVQAASAVVRAQQAGIRRQKVEMLLPQAGVTSAQGSWPGGIRQQAQVAIPALMEPLLRQLKQQEALQVSHM